MAKAISLLLLISVFTIINTNHGIIGKINMK